MNTQDIINEKESQILSYKAFLSETDYKVIKHAEGYEISEAILSQRASVREAINSLEAEIEVLKQQLEIEKEISYEAASNYGN